METFHLPAEPLVVIQPSKKWNLLSLKDIWAYRELLFFLTWRAVKVHYKQTALGAARAPRGLPPATVHDGDLYGLLRQTGRRGLFRNSLPALRTCGTRSRDIL